MKLRFRSPLLAAALLATTLAPSSFAQNLGRPIDAALRSLRAKQASSGLWGESIEDTALVLYAYATSPRKFTVFDGPWLRRGVEALLAQRKGREGSFGTPRESLLASLALEALKTDVGVEVWRDAARGALRSLGHELAENSSGSALASLTRKALGENLPPAEPAPEAAAALAEQLLAQKQADGGFGEPRATALQILLLSRCADALARKAAASAPKKASAALPAPLARYDLAAMRAKAARFLLDPAQRIGERWGFAGNADLGITGMVIGGLHAIPEQERSPEVREAIARGLELLAKAQRPDGSIHEGQVIAYSTSIAILALARSPKPEHASALQRARAFLVGLQSDEGEGYDENHKYYGGIGYGGSDRPDLSNLQKALDALVATGAAPEDAALQKALVFLQRAQNRSESNQGEIVNGEGVFVAGNDGGGIYAPGESHAGLEAGPDGRRIARSYGSMTYALLKGFLYAGLPKEDGRVKAAFDWISRHYTIDENPGFDLSADPNAGQQGLYYYLLAMAKTLDLYGAEQVVDAAGRAHPWRKEIAARLAALQRADGSWVNAQSERWMEGNAVLATAYALQALEFCR
ncbi:MAG: hypothetical protein IPN34_25160 [Planctomycetes bacterium]|nr:hypothetical protein [Planctomycetota bacterium]